MYNIGYIADDASLPRWNVLVNVASRTVVAPSVLELMFGSGNLGSETYRYEIPKDLPANGTHRFEYSDRMVVSKCNPLKGCTMDGMFLVTWKGGDGSKDTDTIVIPYIAMEYHVLQPDETALFAWTRPGAYTIMKKDQKVLFEVVKKVDSYDKLDQFVRENSTGSAGTLSSVLSMIIVSAMIAICGKNVL